MQHESPDNCYLGTQRKIPGIRTPLLVGTVAWFPPPAKPDETLGADVTVKEGTVFSFEPGARIGPHAQVKVGGCGVVTSAGVRMFNSFGTRMRIV